MGNELSRSHAELLITHNEDVPGLKPETIEELRSIVFHYGSYFPDEPHILNFASLGLGTSTPLILSTSSEPRPLYMIVGKSETPAVFLVRTSKGALMWDQSLTAQEAEQAVAEMNSKATELGIYNPETKERVMMRGEAKGIRYSVEDTFLTPGTSFFVGDQNPVDVLNQFDKPELLMIQELSSGAFVIVLRKDIYYNKRRQKIATEILIRRGIDLDNPEAVARLSVDDILAIRKEVEERLQD